MEEHVHDDSCDHGHALGNPLDNLSPEIQAKIQELQSMEQSFQQLMQQKNAFSMEATETDYIMKEVGEAEGEISRIIGGQVIVKTTKEAFLETMEHKKKLIETRMNSINDQEKEFSEKIEAVREEVMSSIQG